MKILKLLGYLCRFEFINQPGPLYLDKDGNLNYFDEKCEYTDHDPKLWDKCLNEHSNIVIPLHHYHVGQDMVECIERKNFFIAITC